MTRVGEAKEYSPDYKVNTYTEKEKEYLNLMCDMIEEQAEEVEKDPDLYFEICRQARIEIWGFD